MQQITIKLNQHRFITSISISSDFGSQYNLLSLSTGTYIFVFNLSCVCRMASVESIPPNSHPFVLTHRYQLPKHDNEKPFLV